LLLNPFKILGADLICAVSSSRAHKSVDVVKPANDIVTSSHEVSDVVKSCECGQDDRKHPLLSTLERRRKFHLVFAMRFKLPSFKTLTKLEESQVVEVGNWH